MRQRIGSRDWSWDFREGRAFEEQKPFTKIFHPSLTRVRVEGGETARERGDVPILPTKVLEQRERRLLHRSREVQVGQEWQREAKSDRERDREIGSEKRP
jgi:hypothetical protein